MRRFSFLPFALPDVEDGEVLEVTEALRSGWLTTGPKTRAFEEAFSIFLGGGVETVAVNSGTAALHLALEALGVGVGDEVIIPTYTFTATAEVVRYLGANPVFVDSLPGQFNIDPCSVESAITGRTRAVVPVHFAGEPCAMAELYGVAQRHGVAIVEDAAHALPARHGGKLVGALPSNATAFSFYATKPLATGEGGMLVTRSPEIAARCRVMRLHGIDREVFDRYRSTRPNWYYEVVAPGFKYNMPDIAAALGLAQLRRVQYLHRRRLEIARMYDEAFRDLPVALPPRPSNMEDHAWHLYVIRLDREAPVSRDGFVEGMCRAQIGTSVHFIPLHRHPYWRNTYGLKDGMFPHATRAFEAAVSLPIYSKMNDRDVGDVIEAARRLLTDRAI